MKHPSVTRADTDGLYYLTSDLDWLVSPTDEDSGVLGPAVGAKPRDRETALEVNDGFDFD